MSGPATEAVRRRDPDEGSRVLRELRHRITTGALPPGAQLHEQALATDLGVSRSRLREGFARLEATGLIERTPNRGAFVHRMTIDEARQIFEAREALEGMCARLAARNVPSESWQDLVDLFADPTERLVERGDLEAYLANVALVRRRMVAAAGNAVIARTLTPLLDRSAVSMRRVILATNRAQDGLTQYRPFLAALRAGDAEAAENLKRAQLREAWAALERYHRLVL